MNCSRDEWVLVIHFKWKQDGPLKKAEKKKTRSFLSHENKERYLKLKNTVFVAQKKIV